MAVRSAYYIISPTGRVERDFPNRAAARRFAREHGGAKAGYRSGEYHLRVAGKVRRGIPRDVARGHAKGNAVVIPKHRTRSGVTVRRQWTIGAPEQGELTLARLRHRLDAFVRSNGDLDVVAFAIFGIPYRDRELGPRWAGGVIAIEELYELIAEAEGRGSTLARDVSWLNRPLWASIQEVSFARPGV